MFDRIREQNRLKREFQLQQKENPDNFSFTINEDIQEKSFVHPDLIAMMKEEEEAEKQDNDQSTKKKKKEEKKKNN